jgi:hypothetical protein
MSLWNLLLLAGLAFIAWAIFTYYRATPADQTVWRRVWLSITAAAASLAAWVASFWAQGTPPGS